MLHRLLHACNQLCNIAPTKYKKTRQNEPHIYNLQQESELTVKYLLPVMNDIYACFLALRLQLDPVLRQAQTIKLGTLYVDVTNDTVTPTMPKVEIMPFNQASFIPIRDFEPW